MTAINYGLMWKTVSEDCNLACDYCYYSRIAGRPETIRKPPLPVLQRVLKNYMASCAGVASIVWQGGEPLLGGMPFFEDVVSLEAQYAKPGTVISNAVQTNGILLNRQWATFFKQYRFLVGLSIDGPRQLHDQRRVNAAGHGTYDRVMAGAGYLRDAGVEFNILTVVGAHNINHVPALMQFYRDNGFHWIQFLPEMAFHSQTPGTPGLYAITPEQYGNFLCEVFDLWYQNGNPDLSIRFIDNVMQTYLHLAPDICTMRSHCPSRLVLESNGDIYPCDFFMGDEWRIGNIMDVSLEEALTSPVMRRFQQLKPDLPEACQRCAWLAQCHGGCPRNRGWAEDPMGQVDYFCESFKQFFAYTDERLRRLVRAAEKRSLLMRTVR